MDAKIIAEIKVNGSALPDNLKLSSMNIGQAFYGHTEFWLNISAANGVNLPAEKYADFFMGGEVVVELYQKENAASKDKGKKLRTFRGFIMGMNAENESLQLNGASESFQLDVVRRQRGFGNKPVKTIVQKVLGDSGVKHDCQANGDSLKPEYLAQYQETDWAFLKRLAEYDAAVFFHDGEKIIYRTELPQNGKACTLKPGDLDGGDGAIALSLQPVKAQAYHHRKKKRFQDNELVSATAKAQSQSAICQTLMKKAETLFGKLPQQHDDNCFNKAEISQWMENQLKLASGSLYTLSGATTSCEVRLGEQIRFEGHRFLNEPFVVARLNLYYQEGRVRTTFQAIPAGFSALASGGEFAQRRNVTQPAIVVDNKDKDNLGRVQIRFPWEANASKEDLPWVRILASAAGQKQGSHFMPKAGDNVLVTFEKGDASRPVILGFYYNDDHKPHFVTENGTEEVLLAKTVNGSLVQLIDKKGEQEIVVKMEDGKNLIRMKLGDAPEILIESKGKLKLQAQKIEMKADDEVRIQSKKVIVKGDGEGIFLN